jgi:hypothetical protein
MTNGHYWTWGHEIAFWFAGVLILTVIGTEIYWLWSAL